MTDEEKKAVDKINKLVEYLRKWNDNVTIVPADIKYFEKILDMIKTYTRMIDENIEEILEQSKEIEELKASHITTNNKATNTEKAKIFDVIENSINTYIEKSKPYWEQIMTKDEMTIEEALTIIDDMYQDRYKIMSQKTEKETIVDLGKMDYIKFTNLEWASVRALREVQSLSKEIEELNKSDESKEQSSMKYYNLYKELVDKIKAKIEEVKDGTYDAKIVLESLL